MGTIRFIDTRSSLDGTYSTIEYEFSDYADFKDYQESQRQAVTTVINNMMFNNPFDEVFESEDFHSPTEDLEGDESGEKIVDIKVGKKSKPPTKH